MSDLTTFRDHCRRMASRVDILSDGDRALFVRLADEVDAYLAHDPDVVLDLEPTTEDTALWEDT